jgi:light-harvesting complex II chlorophyll a/b binding protein 5
MVTQEVPQTADAMEADEGSWSRGFAGGLFASFSGIAAAFLTLRYSIWRQSSATPQLNAVELRQNPISMALSDPSLLLQGADPVYIASPGLRGTLQGSHVANFTTDRVAALDGRASAFTAPMHGTQRMDTQRTAATPTALRMQLPISEDRQREQEEEIAKTNAEMKKTSLGEFLDVTEDQEIAKAKAEMTILTGGAEFAAKGQVQDDGPVPVATGGTQYASPDPVTPLFLIPEKSVVGEGKMVGDKGFDPLGFADSVEKLRIYREAELKHGRLAMLAALGWPVSEALDKPLASAMGMKSLLVSTPTGIADSLPGSEQLLRAPSLLNGGLENVSPVFWGAVFAFSAATELYATKIKKRAGFRATLAALGAEDLTGVDIDGDGQVGAPTMLSADNYLPGDLGFDPLGLYKGSDEDKRTMQLKELNNGRLAMIAVTGYAFNEAATKIPVFNSGS